MDASPRVVGEHTAAGRIYLVDGADGLVLRQYASLNPEDDGFLGTDFVVLEGEGLLVAGANGESSGGAEQAGRLYGLPLP